MIHTKELRTGNMVKNIAGEIITVQQLLHHTLVYERKIVVKREPVQVLASGEQDYITQLNEVVKEADYHDIEAIPLTEHLLQKCGFRNYLREQWIISIGSNHIDWSQCVGSSYGL